MQPLLIAEIHIDQPDEFAQILLIAEIPIHDDIILAPGHLGGPGNDPFAIHQLEPSLLSPMATIARHFDVATATGLIL